MKNDEQEINSQPQSSNLENPGATAEPVANNNGHETNEPGRAGAGEASGKPTVSSRKLAANRRNARKSTGPKTASGKKKVSRNAVRHGFFSKFLLIQHRDGKEARTNTTTSMLAFVNTISRLAGSKNSGWKRSQYGLGGFADSYVVRAVRLIELLPGIVTSSSNQRPMI